jgi:hypothetical protein
MILLPYPGDAGRGEYMGIAIVNISGESVFSIGLDHEAKAIWP